MNAGGLRGDRDDQEEASTGISVEMTSQLKPRSLQSGSGLLRDRAGAAASDRAFIRRAPNNGLRKSDSVGVYSATSSHSLQPCS
jgi:hypothetical protein